MPYADRRILIYMEDTRPVGYDAYGPVFQQLPSKMVDQHRSRPSCDEKRCEDYVVEPRSPCKNNSPKETDGNNERWNEKYNKIVRQSESPQSEPQRYTSPKKEMYFSQYRKTSPGNYDVGVEKVMEKEDPTIQHASNGSKLNIIDKASISPRSSSRAKGSPIRECIECFCRGCVRSHNIDESVFREKVKIDDKGHGYVKPCRLACCYDRNTIYKQNHYDECKDATSPYGGPRNAFSFQEEDRERRRSTKNSSFALVDPSSRRNDSERPFVDVYTKNSNTVYRAHKSYGLHKAFYTSPRYSAINHELSKGARLQEDDVAPHWQKIEYNNIRSIYEGSVSPRSKFRENSADSIRFETKMDQLKDANVNDNYAIEKSGFKRFLKTSPRDNHDLLRGKFEDEMTSRNSKEKLSNVIKWQSDSTTNRNCPPKRTISTTPPNCLHKVCSNESAKIIHDEYKQPVIGYNAHGGKFSPISHCNGVYYHSNNQSEIKQRARSQSHISDGYLIRTNGTNPYNQIRQMNLSPNSHRYLEAKYYRNSPTMTSEPALIHSSKRDIHENPMLLSNHCNGDRFMAIREHHPLTPPPPKLLRVPPERGGLPPPEMITTVKQRMYGMFGGASRMPNEQLHPIVGVEKKRTKTNKCLHLWQFLRKTLDEEEHKEERCIEWTDRELGEFRLINTAALADRWGQSKNSSCMTYEKMARAMRYYYNTNILEKVPHKRLHFRFSAKISTNILQESKSKDLKNENSNVSNGDSNHSNENKNDIKEKNVNENKNDNDPKINDVNYSSYNDWNRNEKVVNDVEYKKENKNNLDNSLKQKNDNAFVKNNINGQDMDTVGEQKMHLHTMRNEDENQHDKSTTLNSIDDNENKYKDDVVIILSEGNQKYRQHDVFLKKEIDDVTKVTSSHLNVPISTISGVWSDATTVEDLIIDTDSD